MNIAELKKLIEKLPDNAPVVILEEPFCEDKLGKQAKFVGHTVIQDKTFDCFAVDEGKDTEELKAWGNRVLALVLE